MENLDYYMSTEDELFNLNADLWYSIFHRDHAEDTEKPFLTFIQALHEAYFHIVENVSKPFACIEFVKGLFDKYSFNQAEQKIMADYLKAIIARRTDINEAKWQIMDKRLFVLRNDIYPYDQEFHEEGGMDLISFDFNRDVKSVIDNMTDNQEKLTHIGEVLFNYKEKSLKMEPYELDFYISEFLPQLRVAIERIKFGQTRDAQKAKPVNWSSAGVECDPATKPTYETLDDMFYDKAKIEPAINILRQTDPPLISDQGVFIGKHKYALVLWLNKLRVRGIVKPEPNDALLSTLLSERFEGFKIGASTIRTGSPTAEEKYGSVFAAYAKEL